MYAVDVSGNVAWVTGGSRGIGRAAAIALAQAGAHVAISYRSRASEADAVVAEITKAGGKALAVAADAADPAALESAYAHISETLGPVTVLVNNAGVIADNLFAMLEDEDWEKVLATNVMGVVRTTRLVLKGMMLKRHGRIINLSSAAGTKGGRGQANYAASKGAVEAMTRSLATEVGRRGITVNCVAPGVIETDMSAEVRKLATGEILARQVVQRFGKPEEVAAWIVFLASTQGGFITGQTIHIDGGLKMA